MFLTREQAYDLLTGLGDTVAEIEHQTGAKVRTGALEIIRGILIGIAFPEASNDQ